VFLLPSKEEKPWCACIWFLVLYLLWKTKEFYGFCILYLKYNFRRITHCIPLAPTKGKGGAQQGHLSVSFHLYQGNLSYESKQAGPRASRAGSPPSSPPVVHSQHGTTQPKFSVTSCDLLSVLGNGSPCLCVESQVVMIAKPQCSAPATCLLLHVPRHLLAISPQFQAPWPPRLFSGCSPRLLPHLFPLPRHTYG
jgi:hypothetical protein